MMDPTTQFDILIVDDDDVDRDRVRRILASTGLAAKVRESESGSEGLALCAQESFDCAILDCDLPDMPGIELIGKFVEKNLAVIMLTGNRDHKTAVFAMKSGAKDYLVKSSLTEEVLYRAVLNSMEKQRLELALAEQNRKLKTLGFYDTLTGLPNRHLFLDRLEQICRSAKREASHSFAVCMMDLDLFKPINDTFGHQVGDEVLVEVANRIRSITRDADTLARLGGDEFGAILPSTDNVQSAATVAQKICEAVAKPITVKDHTLKVGISTGIAFGSRNSHDPKVLLRIADQAMYLAKSCGKGFEIIDEMGTAPSKLGMLMPEVLRNAIANDEFVLHYQPKVCFQTGMIAGVEALVRWNHPVHGLIPPMEFIPSIERTSLISQLTTDVIDKALRQLAVWHAAGLDFPVSVNISPKLLRNSHLNKALLEIQGRHGLSLRNLIFEITETSALVDIPSTPEILTSILETGVQLSIDDFGCGYTSLRYFRDLPISEIKIDRLFVKDLQNGTKDHSIIQAILALASGLHISVVAEGVETWDVWETLRSMGCTMGQGYVIARPMPAAEFDVFYNSWRKQDRVAKFA